MATLNELEREYHAAQADTEAWAAAIQQCNRIIEDAKAEIAGLLNTHHEDMAAALDRIALLQDRVRVAQLFIINYQDSIRYGVLSRMQRAAERYHAAQKAAQALPDAIARAEREVRAAREQLQAATSDE